MPPKVIRNTKPSDEENEAEITNATLLKAIQKSEEKTMLKFDEIKKDMTKIKDKVTALEEKHDDLQEEHGID